MSSLWLDIWDSLNNFKYASAIWNTRRYFPCDSSINYWVFSTSDWTCSSPVTWSFAASHNDLNSFVMHVELPIAVHCEVDLFWDRIIPQVITIIQAILNLLRKLLLCREHSKAFQEYWFHVYSHRSIRVRILDSIYISSVLDNVRQSNTLAHWVYYRFELRDTYCVCCDLFH